MNLKIDMPNSNETAVYYEASIKAAEITNGKSTTIKSVWASETTENEWVNEWNVAMAMPSF